MNNYFIDCTTIEEIKKKFKMLVLKYHPDLQGGDLEIMKLINIQYQEALKKGDGQKSKGDDEKEHIYKYSDELEEELANKMIDLIALQMVDVEIHLIGLWLWITGETKQYKDKLKEIGCWWHSKRECWYFKADKQRYSFHKYGNLEDIAKKYGSFNINNFKKYENRKPIKNGLVKT